MGFVEKIIENLLVKAAVDETMKVMEKEEKKPGEKLFGDILILRFNVVIKMLIYGYLIFSLFIGVIGIFTIEDGTDLYIYLGLMAFLLILNTILISAFRNIRIEVDKRSITKYGVFGRTKEIWWNEITGVKIMIAGKSAIITADKKKLRATSQFIGYNDFLEYVKRKVDPELIRIV